MASSRAEGKKHPFSVSSFPVSIILLLVTIIGWGGLRWYLYMLDKKITDIDATLSVSSGQLSGEAIDRLVDFDARMALLGADPAELIDPQALFMKLEALVVPQVLLTKYEYNDRDQVMTISGRTASFRYLAEQLISFKSDATFARVQVTEIDRTEEGAIEFVLRNNF